MKLTLLGTSCMVPTKKRNVSGMHLDFEGIGILFDCGEGTQRQMNLVDLNRNKLNIICISHWHADHVAGLLGLLQTIDAKERKKKLTIVGPIETKERLQHLIDATYCNMQLELNIIEVESTPMLTKVYETEQFEISAVSLEHGIPCVGYTFVEKERFKIDMNKLREADIPTGPHLKQLQKGVDGEYSGKTLSVSEYTTIVPQKKIGYIADTRVCEGAHMIATNADLLVSESTYEAEQEENAKQYNHMTCVQAAQIAKDCDAKKLILTHISQRYKYTTRLLEQAKEVFENVIVGEDFQEEKL